MGHYDSSTKQNTKNRHHDNATLIITKIYIDTFMLIGVMKIYFYCVTFKGFCLDCFYVEGVTFAVRKCRLALQSN
jgi:uncharacterized membrane protein